MSYDVYIGQPKEKMAGGEACLCVQSVERPGAPSWKGDELTGKGNSRHPSYAGFDSWCGQVGLMDLFFDPKNGLMRKHPGIVRLKQEHLNQIKEAKARFIKGNPEVSADFISERGHLLARLVWFEWWMDWALKNCDEPSLQNS